MERYCGWAQSCYDGWVCHDKACEAEKFFETVVGLDCYLVYSMEHVWNIVMVDGIPYEFESTCLSFQNTSELFDIADVRMGFYVDGCRVDYCSRLDDWELLFK